MSEGGANVPSMEAVAWSAIGLLGATLAVLTGALLSLSSRMSALEERLGVRIDAQGAELAKHIEEQGRETRGRIDAMNSRLDPHIEPHAG